MLLTEAEKAESRTMNSRERLASLTTRVMRRIWTRSVGTRSRTLCTGPGKARMLSAVLVKISSQARAVTVARKMWRWLLKQPRRPYASSRRASSAV